MLPHLMFRCAVVIVLTAGCWSLFGGAAAAQEVDPPMIESGPVTTETAPAVDLPTEQPIRRSSRYSRSGTSASQGSALRLASAPNMFGDFFNQGGQVSMTGTVNALADMPLAGGGRRAKIAENNKALPVDRCYFMYHHFQNALSANPNTLLPGLTRDFSVDRYTIGMEKTFFDGLWSIDVRMPFTRQYGVSPGKFAVGAGDIGNLSIGLKRLLAVSDRGALAAGLLIDTPTGSDATCRAATTNITMHNDAVHLSPFVGFLAAPNDCFFYHGFLQVDVAANGNRIDYADNYLVSSGRLGTLSEQTLMHVDFSVGRWLYRNSCRRGMTGLASIIEFHYTTALQDADVISGTLGGTSASFGNLRNRFDIVNLTVGLHAEMARKTTIRVAGVFPLNAVDRPFDSEVQVSVNRRF